MTDIDFIGDIHGHADQLEQLLSKLEYKRDGKGYKHSSRKVLFVGDYIDRGPNNPRVVELVRAMVDKGQAIAQCGNHEFNAVCFNTLTSEGYVRLHIIKNYKQHSETMLQFHGKQEAYNDAIEWFKTLPLYYETDHYRAVHATWDQESIAYLKQNTKEGILTNEQFSELINQDGGLAKHTEVTCKGIETKLPDGLSFYDKDNTERFDIRVKWWVDQTKNSLKDLSVIEDLDLPKNRFMSDERNYYHESENPVFFGHYWLKGDIL